MAASGDNALISRRAGDVHRLSVMNPKTLQQAMHQQPKIGEPAAAPEAALATSTKKPWYILLPDHPFNTASELSSMLALILIFFVLPFEIAFVDSPNIPDPADGLYIFNRVIDIIFIVDLATTFVVALPKESVDDEAAALGGADEEEEGSLLAKNTQYEYRLSRIAIAYAKGWLALDSMSMVPSAFDVYFAVSGQCDALDEEGAELVTSTLRMLSEGSDAPGASSSLGAARMTRTLKLVKFMRMARMLKMLRLLRLTKLLKFLTQDGIVKHVLDTLYVALAEHTRKLRVARLLLTMLLAIHAMGCILGVSATFANEKVESWWGTHGYCWPDRLYQLRPCEPYKSECVDAFSQYLICFHLALSLAFKVPFGPFVLVGPGFPYYANAETSNTKFQAHEHATFVSVGMTGAMLGMYLTGTFVAVVAAKDGASVTEQVTTFCRKYHVSNDKRKQMLSYFASVGDLAGTMPKSDVFSKLSPAMLTEIVLDVHGKWLRHLPFAPFLDYSLHGELRSLAFRRNGTTLLSKIALAMSPAIFVPRERPATGRLYVIVRGIAVQTISRLMRPGDSWGAYQALLTAATATDGGMVKAMTNLQVVYVDAGKLRQLQHQHPEIKAAWARARTWALLTRWRWGRVRAVAKMKAGGLLLASPSPFAAGRSPSLKAAGGAIASPALAEEAQQQQQMPVAGMSEEEELLSRQLGEITGAGAAAALARSQVQQARRLANVEDQLKRLCDLMERTAQPKHQLHPMEA